MTRLIIYFAIFLTGCGKEGYICEALDVIEPNYYACAVMRVTKGDLFYCRTTNQNVLKVRLLGVEIDGAKGEELKEFTDADQIECVGQYRRFHKRA